MQLVCRSLAYSRRRRIRVLWSFRNRFVAPLLCILLVLCLVAPRTNATQILRPRSVLGDNNDFDDNRDENNDSDNDSRPHVRRLSTVIDANRVERDARLRTARVSIARAVGSATTPPASLHSYSLATSGAVRLVGDRDSLAGHVIVGGSMTIHGDVHVLGSSHDDSRTTDDISTPSTTDRRNECRVGCRLQIGGDLVVLVNATDPTTSNSSLTIVGVPDDERGVYEPMLSSTTILPTPFYPTPYDLPTVEQTAIVLSVGGDAPPVASSSSSCSQTVCLACDVADARIGVGKHAALGQLDLARALRQSANVTRDWLHIGVEQSRVGQVETHQCEPSVWRARVRGALSTPVVVLPPAVTSLSRLSVELLDLSRANLSVVVVVLTCVECHLSPRTNRSVTVVSDVDGVSDERVPFVVALPKAVRLSIDCGSLVGAALFAPLADLRLAIAEQNTDISGDDDANDDVETHFGGPVVVAAVNSNATLTSSCSIRLGEDDWLRTRLAALDSWPSFRSLNDTTGAPTTTPSTTDEWNCDGIDVTPAIAPTPVVPTPVVAPTPVVPTPAFIPLPPLPPMPTPDPASTPIVPTPAAPQPSVSATPTTTTTNGGGGGGGGGDGGGGGFPPPAVGQPTPSPIRPVDTVPTGIVMAMHDEDLGYAIDYYALPHVRLAANGTDEFVEFQLLQFLETTVDGDVVRTMDLSQRYFRKEFERLTVRSTTGSLASVHTLHYKLVREPNYIVPSDDSALNRNTDVDAWLSYYEEETAIRAGSYTYLVPAGALKWTLRIRNWSFENQENRLRLKLSFDFFHWVIDREVIELDQERNVRLFTYDSLMVVSLLTFGSYDNTTANVRTNVDESAREMAVDFASFKNELIYDPYVFVELLDTSVWDEQNLVNVLIAVLVPLLTCIAGSFVLIFKWRPRLLLVNSARGAQSHNRSLSVAGSATVEGGGAHASNGSSSNGARGASDLDLATAVGHASAGAPRSHAALSSSAPMGATQRIAPPPVPRRQHSAVDSTYSNRDELASLAEPDDMRPRFVYQPQWPQLARRQRQPPPSLSHSRASSLVSMASSPQHRRASGRARATTELPQAVQSDRLVLPRLGGDDSSDELDLRLQMDLDSSGIGAF